MLWIFAPFAGRARILGADVVYDTELRRDEVKLLAFFLADTRTLSTACALLLVFGDVVDHFYGRKAIWKDRTLCALSLV